MRMSAVVHAAHIVNNPEKQLKLEKLIGKILNQKMNSRIAELDVLSRWPKLNVVIDLRSMRGL